jgi:glutathione S-transferase
MAAVTLHYFDLYARGELIRMILTYHGVDFVDHRVTMDEWSTLRTSGLAEFGQLPVLEIDGLKLVESRSISRYLCQKFGYYPSDPVDVYWVESLCDLKEDIFSSVAKTAWGTDTEALEKVYKEDIPWWLEKIEARLVRNQGGDGWFVGNDISRADFEIFQLVWDGILRPGLKEKFSHLLEVTPKLDAFVKRFVESSQRLKEYLGSRPICTL